jgi:glycosyltransferase involved in cell wall biosynthesis
MKIAYVCNEYPPAPHGGIGTFVYTMAHGMARRGHAVTVAGWGPSPGERDDEGVRVVTLPMSRTRFIGWYLHRRRLADWLSREALKGSIDLVETVDFEGALIHRIKKVPVVVRLHLTDSSIQKHSGMKLRRVNAYCEKKQLALYSTWIAVSRFALELTRETFGLGPTDSRIIYSPIGPPRDARPFLPPLPRPFVLFAGGKVSRRKGALVLAAAAADFLKKHRRLHLVFAGSLEHEKGAPIDRLIRDILGPALSKRVSFLGRLSRDQIMAIMRKAVVFAYPSTLETFGLVIGEAMIQGSPVVVCEGGPSPEFVEHEKTGLMVPPNDPAALSEAVERLLKNRKLAKRMSLAASRQARHRFSLKKSINDSMEFYRNRIASKMADLRIAAGSLEIAGRSIFWERKGGRHES